MIVAFAGRRIDDAGATKPRFPAENEALVRERLRHTFTQLGATAIVAAAANGADIIALEVASELGMQRVVVLPSDVAAFRASSVVDRGVEWGPRYDRIVDRVARVDEVHSLGMPSGGDAYVATNGVILERALSLAGGAEGVAAVVVWENAAHAATDYTEQFVRLAKDRAVTVHIVSPV